MYSIYKNNYIKYISILLILTLVLSSCGKNNNIVKREANPPTVGPSGGPTIDVKTGTGKEIVTGTDKEIGNGTGKEIGNGTGKEIVTGTDKEIVNGTFPPVTEKTGIWGSAKILLSEISKWGSTKLESIGNWWSNIPYETKVIGGVELGGLTVGVPIVACVDKCCGGGGVPPQQVPPAPLVAPSSPYNSYEYMDWMNDDLALLFDNQVLDNQVLDNQVLDNQVQDNQVLGDQVQDNQVQDNQVQDNQVLGGTGEGGNTENKEGGSTEQIIDDTVTEDGDGKGGGTGEGGDSQGGEGEGGTDGDKEVDKKGKGVKKGKEKEGQEVAAEKEAAKAKKKAEKEAAKKKADEEKEKRKKKKKQTKITNSIKDKSRKHKSKKQKRQFNLQVYDNPVGSNAIPTLFMPGTMDPQIPGNNPPGVTINDQLSIENEEESEEEEESSNDDEEESSNDEDDLSEVQNNNLTQETLAQTPEVTAVTETPPQTIEVTAVDGATVGGTTGTNDRAEITTEVIRTETPPQTIEVTTDNVITQDTQTLTQIPEVTEVTETTETDGGHVYNDGHLLHPPTNNTQNLNTLRPITIQQAIDIINNGFTVYGTFTIRINNGGEEFSYPISHPQLIPMLNNIANNGFTIQGTFTILTDDGILFTFSAPHLLEMAEIGGEYMGKADAITKKYVKMTDDDELNALKEKNEVDKRMTTRDGSLDLEKERIKNEIEEKYKKLTYIDEHNKEFKDLGKIRDEKVKKLAEKYKIKGIKHNSI